MAAHPLGLRHTDCRDRGIGMPAALTPPPLSAVVGDYANILQTSRHLLLMHPRKVGNPSDYAALAPAAVLTTVAAFEAIAESLLAVAAARRGQSLGQIAKFASINNPTPQTLFTKLKGHFGWMSNPPWATHFSVRTLEPPAVGRANYRAVGLAWQSALDAADSWMQVRHCLTHGLATGRRPEYWPGPLKGTPSAIDVLRPKRDGKFSLGLHGALSCFNIYLAFAQTLTNQVAVELGDKKPGWHKAPFLPIT